MHVPAREQTALQVGFMPIYPTCNSDMLLMKMTCTLHSGTDLHAAAKARGAAPPEGANAIDGQDALPRKTQPGRALAP